MKVVIDTNVFVSSFFGSNPGKVIGLWRSEKMILCLSRDILDEYIEVLRRVGLEKELEELLLLFSSGFNLLFTARTPKIKVVLDDPSDDKFIECAVALKADVVITGDKALGAVKEYRGIKVLTPVQFLRDFKV